MYYKDKNVFDEALDRIRFIYDTHDDVIVSMSGGKDSTTVFNLALMVARERNRLPLKVLWLDQEAEWQSTVDYVGWVMHLDYVQPYWFQFPFDFTNSLSNKKNFIRVWDETKEDYWVHPKSDISNKENPTKHNRFHKIISDLAQHCTDSDNCAVLTGMRIQESAVRRLAIAFGDAKFQGINWCQKKNGKIRVFYPIYDFTTDDVWIAIAKNNWKYNTVYDKQYRYGVPKNDMRVSALIHETAWHAVLYLQELEPATYDRFIKRISGVSTFNHLGSEVIVRELPFAFSSWKEYRDYLLEKIVKPEYWELFRKRWEAYDDDDFYKLNVRECIINDIDGTLFRNYEKQRRLGEMNAPRDGSRYYDRDKKEIQEFMKGEK